MKYLPLIFPLLLLACASKKPMASKSEGSNCIENLTTFENEFLSSCPISLGPEKVLAFLAKFPNYHRNKDFDFGNGSVRFNAKNATIYGIPVVDERSTFLLNHDIDKMGYDSWILFQAIYFFERKEDKEEILNLMSYAIKEKLDVVEDVKHNNLNEPYVKVYFPCGSGFNLKHGERDGKYVIDILWAKTSK